MDTSEEKASRSIQALLTFASRSSLAQSFFLLLRAALMRETHFYTILN